MQQVSSALLSALETGIDPGTGSVVRDLTYMIEFYEPSVLPGANGFDPSDASELFAPITMTWLGQAYRRAVLSASDISKTKGARANKCTVRLANSEDTPEDAISNRYVANWVQSTQVEGMRMVVRLISRSASTTLADSAILFVGRCERPENFDVVQGSITATADFGSVDYEVPPRLYTADDPNGRSPADPLYEGFPFYTVNGAFTYAVDKTGSWWTKGRRYQATQPFSSYDDTPLGEPLIMILGRSQIKMNRGIYVDRGRVTDCLDFACMGPIEAFVNFHMDMEPDYARYFVQENFTYHLGDPGNTGTNLADPLFPNHGYFSNTACVTFQHRYIGTGSFTNIDAGHQTVSVVLGLRVALPDSSGVFNTVGWTDNGAYLTRHLLTDPRFFNNDEAFIEDSAGYLTGQINDRPVFDTSNSEVIYVPDPDYAAAGVSFLRFNSTGLINTRRARYLLGIDGLLPEELPADDYTSFDPDTPPTLAVNVTRLRKGFTSNVLLRKRVKGLDFLFNTLLPSFRGYLVWNYRGKIEIRSERPADFTHFNEAASAGASTMAVEDVTPWIGVGNRWGKLLIGAGLTTSEVRTVTSAGYTTSANSITLVASKTGGVTATASGATLSGGSGAAPAAGTITVGGSPAAGNTVTATINGVGVTYTLEGDVTAATVAQMLAASVNAHTRLRRFVAASASGSVVTITSKWGHLAISSPLVNNHNATLLADPATAPAGLSASGAGSQLAAGTYRVAYANRNAAGSTYVSPYASVTVSAGQQIDVPALALPAGGVSRDWYVSKAPNDPEMVLHANAAGSAFAVTAPPNASAAFPPEYNTTGEELIRVAMSFASNNQTATVLAQAGLTRGNVFAGSYRWPMSGQQPSYTQVVGEYVNAAQDFAPSKVEINDRERRARLGKVSPKNLDLTAVDNYHQARRLALYDFSKYVDHHWFNTLKSNGPALLLEEGDVLCASDDSGGHVNALTQIEELTIHLSDFTVTVNRARQYTSGMFRELVPKTRPAVPSVLQWTATLGTDIQLLDVPHFRERDAELGAGFHVAVWRDDSALGDWRGATLWVDAGQGYKEAVGWDVEAYAGEASVVTSFGETVYGRDAAGGLRVVMRGGAALSTYTEEEFRAGAGLYRLGDEIFQGRVATLVAPGTYDITDVVRGRFGTEGFTGGHAAGEEFTVLDSRVLFVPFNASHAGRQLKVKAVTTNQDFADAAEHLFTWSAKTRQPLAPARIDTDETTQLAPRDSAGSILITAWPRSNFGNIGDEYLAEFLSDDGLTVMHRMVFEEGVATAAVLESGGATKYTSVSYNTLSDTGGSSILARTLQAVRGPGNYFEGTLVLDDVTAEAGVGFQSSRGPWPTPSYPDADIFCRLRCAYTTTGQFQLIVWAGRGTATTTYNLGTGLSLMTQRIRILLTSGGEVRFYQNWQGSATAPFHVGQLAAPYPLRGFAYVNGSSVGAHVRRMIVTTDPYPTTIFSDAQQLRYYGTLKNPCRVRLRQHSGIREVGYGLPFEALI